MEIRIEIGDCREILRSLPDESIHCVVTSPPYYGLRDYGIKRQIGLESHPEEYIAALVGIFREVRRILRSDGTLWLNIGDSYAVSGNGGGGAKQDRNAGSSGGRKVGRPPNDFKPKDLIGVPWRLAFALQEDGWYLRQDIIWAKPNPMPESVRDRCTRAHEYLFQFSKSARYYYDRDAIAEPAVCDDAKRWTDRGSEKQRGHSRRHAGFNGRYAERLMREGPPKTRNRRSVWTVATQPFNGAHFATFPPALIEPCLRAGCPAGGTVLDPFAGAGTTGLVANRLGRNAILIDLNPEYAAIAKRRIIDDAPLLAEVL